MTGPKPWTPADWLGPRLAPTGRDATRTPELRPFYRRPPGALSGPTPSLRELTPEEAIRSMEVGLIGAIPSLGTMAVDIANWMQEQRTGGPVAPSMTEALFSNLRKYAHTEQIAKDRPDANLVLEMLGGVVGPAEAFGAARGFGAVMRGIREAHPPTGFAGRLLTAIERAETPPATSDAPVRTELTGALSPSELVDRLPQEFQTSRGTFDYTGPERRAAPRTGRTPSDLEGQLPPDMRTSRGKLREPNTEIQDDASPGAKPSKLQRIGDSIKRVLQSERGELFPKPKTVLASGMSKDEAVAFMKSTTTPAQMQRLPDGTFQVISKGPVQVQNPPKVEVGNKKDLVRRQLGDQAETGFESGFQSRMLVVLEHGDWPEEGLTLQEWKAALLKHPDVAKSEVEAAFASLEESIVVGSKETLSALLRGDPIYADELAKIERRYHAQREDAKQRAVANAQARSAELGEVANQENPQQWVLDINGQLSGELDDISAREGSEMSLARQAGKWRAGQADGEHVRAVSAIRKKFEEQHTEGARILHHRTGEVHKWYEAMAGIHTSEYPAVIAERQRELDAIKAEFVKGWQHLTELENAELRQAHEAMRERQSARGLPEPVSRLTGEEMSQELSEHTPVEGLRVETEEATGGTELTQDMIDEEAQYLAEHEREYRYEEAQGHLNKRDSALASLGEMLDRVLGEGAGKRTVKAALEEVNDLDENDYALFPGEDDFKKLMSSSSERSDYGRDGVVPDEIDTRFVDALLRKIRIDDPAQLTMDEGTAPPAWRILSGDTRAEGYRGVVKFTGPSGTHSIPVRTEEDLTRAEIHWQGFQLNNGVTGATRQLPQLWTLQDVKPSGMRPALTEDDLRELKRYVRQARQEQENAVHEADAAEDPDYDFLRQQAEERLREDREYGVPDAGNTHHSGDQRWDETTPYREIVIKHPEAKGRSGHSFGDRETFGWARAELHDDGDLFVAIEFQNDIQRDIQGAGRREADAMDALADNERWVQISVGSALLNAASDPGVERFGWVTAANRQRYAKFSLSDGGKAGINLYDTAVPKAVRRIFRWLNLPEPEIKRLGSGHNSHFEIKLPKAVKAKLRKHGIPALGIAGLSVAAADGRQGVVEVGKPTEEDR